MDSLQHQYPWSGTEQLTWSLLRTDDGCSPWIAVTSGWGWKGKDTYGWEVQWSMLRSVINSPTMVVNKCVEDSATVSRQHLSALPFVPVVDYVFWTNIAVPCKPAILHTTQVSALLTMERLLWDLRSTQTCQTTLGHTILIFKIQHSLSHVRIQKHV